MESKINYSEVNPLNKLPKKLPLIMALYFSVLMPLEAKNTEQEKQNITQKINNIKKNIKEDIHNKEERKLKFERYLTMLKMKW